jgi:hypothetical protein
VLALAAVALLAGALAAPASARFRIGIQDDGAFVSAAPLDRALALDRAQRIGVSYLRISMVWAGYRTTGYGPYDVAVDAARRRGMVVQLSVTGNPQFTDGGRGFVGYRYPNAGRYATWIAHIARHFRGRVQYYSVWNEPNLELYLSPQRAGRRWMGPILYARLVRAAYRAVKASDPRAQVLIGELAPSAHPLDFLAALATRPRHPVVADGWAQHPYQFVDVPPWQETYYPGSISRLPAMKDTLAQLARAGLVRTRSGAALPIYLTEFGYPRPGAYYGYFSEAHRAAYTLDAFRLARAAGVRVLVWYQLYTHPGPSQPQLWDTGLMGLDGSPSLIYRRLVTARGSLAGP